MPTPSDPARGAVARRALREAVVKLHPRSMRQNPVMLVVYVGALLTTVLLARDLAFHPGDSSPAFTAQLAIWLWFTVLFANFAEAVAEGRGKAQADTLRASRTRTRARKLDDPTQPDHYYYVSSNELERGDFIVCLPGDVIAGDGEVVAGVASVDESAITGESAPVVRESGGDRSAVTGGTKVLSDFLVVRITAGPGETFLDRMIALVEGAGRQKTPNELALTILLAGLTLILILTVVTLEPLARYAGTRLAVPVLVALLVCLIPTTIGGLLSAIGIAGMDRLIRQNVIAMSGRAVEAAGDVDTLLLDKTGTITLGNRHAVSLHPVGGVDDHYLAACALSASNADETPEGRSIVALARSRYGQKTPSEGDVRVLPFSASTRMSGIDDEVHSVRKGAGDAVTRWVREHGGLIAPELQALVESIARGGGTPLVVAERLHGVNGSVRVLGVIHLKDVVKAGMRERFERLRAMGIRTVMITGDNPLTAAAIASEAGVDDFLAEARPEDKMALVKREQLGGRLVAMTGDGTNDAPALAQADVGVAMNSGTQAAKEAGNMIDLESNPTKLIEVVEVGKQLLMTRGALTTFSIANDVAKYFAILPAMFLTTYPALASLNIMRLHSGNSAILSSVIFNALVIIALIPLALRGVRSRPAPASVILRRNLVLYGGGGLIVPFAGIKLIDMALVAMHLV